MASQVNQSVLDRQKNRLYVHRHQCVPLIRRIVLQGRHVNDARAIDDDVQRAKLIDRLFDGGAHLVLVRYVGGSEQRLAAVGADGANDLVAELLLDIGNGHTGALGGEQLGHGCPDARRTAADPSHLTFESLCSHVGKINPREKPAPTRHQQCSRAIHRPIGLAVRRGIPPGAMIRSRPGPSQAIAVRLLAATVTGAADSSRPFRPADRPTARWE